MVCRRGLCLPCGGAGHLGGYAEPDAEGLGILQAGGGQRAEDLLSYLWPPGGGWGEACTKPSGAVGGPRVMPAGLTQGCGGHSLKDAILTEQRE